MKRKVLRVVTSKPAVNLSLDDGYGTIWLTVSSEGKDQGRAVKLTDSYKDLVNFALSILEGLPITALQEHGGAYDRLKLLSK